MFIPVLRHRGEAAYPERVQHKHLIAALRIHLRCENTQYWRVLRLQKLTELTRPMSSYSCSFSTPHILGRCLKFLLTLSKQGRLLTEAELFMHLKIVWLERFSSHSYTASLLDEVTDTWATPGKQTEPTRGLYNRQHWCLFSWEQRIVLSSCRGRGGREECL